MNRIRKGLIGLAILGSAGGVASAVGVGAASAAAPQVFSATGQLVQNIAIAPGITEHNYNLYQSQVTAPGFKLVATESQICVTGARGNTACTYRLTTVAAPGSPSKQLIGTEVFGPASVGQVGSITGGTGSWARAKGIVQTRNLVPNVASNSFVFSTP